MTLETFRSVYIFVLYATALIAGTVAIVAWRRKQAPGASALAAMMLGQIWWAICYALALSATANAEALFWGSMLFFGVVVGPATFFVFTLQYTGRGGWVNKRTVAALAVEPILFMIAVWTDPLHHLVSAGYQPGGVFVGGSVFWIHTAYSYVLMNAGGFLLVLHALHKSSIYRKQARLLLLGLVVVGTANAATIFHLTPGPTIDFTPIGFTICGVINAVALFRYGLFDLIPIARDAVVELMKDGVVVLDAENRVADFNPAAQELLGLDVKTMLGQPLVTVPVLFDAIAARKPDADVGVDGGVLLERNGRTVDLQITEFHDRDQRPGGRLVVLRNVSHVKRIESELRDANERLRQKLTEIESLQAKLKEQAIRDPLTGLYNRRFLKETLTRELAQATRTQNPLSLAMIDLDHFKRVNDAHGHYAGDRLLEAVGHLLQSQIRGGDVACRYGGEEFVVVMPGAALAAAAQRADEWRQAFAALQVRSGQSLLQCTFSAGVASFPKHGVTADILLDASDRALYAAKAAGRNRVMTAEETSVVFHTSG